MSDLVGAEEIPLPFPEEPSADWQAGWDARGREIDGLLAAAFARHPSSSQRAWQDVLAQVSLREYQRGLDEGRSDD